MPGTVSTLEQWAYRHGVQLELIEPGKPMQNENIESFNGKFHDECLNEHWFETLAQARVLVAAWRHDYSENCLHSALVYLTPAEVAAHSQANSPESAKDKQIV